MVLTFQLGYILSGSVAEKYNIETEWNCWLCNQFVCPSQLHVCERAHSQVSVCIHKPQVHMYILFQTGLQGEFYHLAGRLVPQLLRLIFALQYSLMEQGL